MMRIYTIAFLRGRGLLMGVLLFLGVFLLVGGMIRTDGPFSGGSKLNENSLLIYEDGSLPSDEPTMAGTRLTPIYYVKTEEKIASITLNAADGNEDIPGILDALDDADVTATFFVLGSWADRYPEEMKEIASRGHLIENHSDKHPHMNSMSAAAIKQDIEAAGQKIKKLTGREPVFFRAPYGEYNDTVVKAARELQYEAVQWSVDSIDWRGEGENAVVKRVLENLHPGGIVLLHTNSKDIVPALRRILNGAKEKGYSLVPLDELLYPSPYTIDRRGEQSEGY